MKKAYFIPLCLMGLAASIAVKAADSNYTAYGKVLDVTPVYTTVEERIPKERCWMETVKEVTHPPAKSNHAGTLLGGVIGGAIGNAVGKGHHHRDMSTAVGAVIGAAIGNDISKQGSRHQRPRVAYKEVERCEIRERIVHREVISGYDVRYAFHGEEFYTHTTHKPGDKIKLAVLISPQEY